MVETKLYAVPAEWTQPLFALGERVYDLDDKERGRAPVAGQITGLMAHDACTWDEQAQEWKVVGKSWVYLVAWPGYSPCEVNEVSLAREAWEYTGPVPTVRPGPPVNDDYDPFLDEDPELP